MLDRIAVGKEKGTASGAEMARLQMNREEKVHENGRRDPARAQRQAPHR
jgi:hypothetical protein